MGRVSWKHSRSLDLELSVNQSVFSGCRSFFLSFVEGAAKPLEGASAED